MRWMKIELAFRKAEGHFPTLARRQTGTPNHERKEVSGRGSRPSALYHLERA